MAVTLTNQTSSMHDKFHRINLSLLEDNDLDAAIIDSNAILELNQNEIFESLSSYIKPALIKYLEKYIQNLDHLGFMVPTYIGIENVRDKSLVFGFCHNPLVFDSKVIAKQLGVLRNKPEVKTKIFKAYKANQQGIEIFFPKDDYFVVNQWVYEGIGNHIGIRVPSMEGMLEIQKIMRDSGISMPDFMKNQFLNNPTEKTHIAYYVLSIDSYKLVLEFIFFEN